MSDAWIENRKTFIEEIEKIYNQEGLDFTLDHLKRKKTPEATEFRRSWIAFDRTQSDQARRKDNAADF